MQEQTDIASTGNGDAGAITKSEQAQDPHNDHNNTANSIEGKPPCEDSEVTDSTDNSDSSIRKRNNHPCNLKDLGISDDRKFVRDPGGNNANIKDGSRRDDGDSDSISISISNEPRAADTHRSHDRDRDKTTVFTASEAGAVPPISFAQTTCPVFDTTPQHSADS